MMRLQRRRRQRGVASGATSLALTGLWRGSYGGSPWLPTASAGTSGSNQNLVEATNPPAVGASVGGYTPAAFDGVADVVTSEATNKTALFTDTAGTIAVLFYADSAAAANVNAYSDVALFADVGINFGLFFSADGVRSGIYTGTGWVQPAATAAATGAWHLGQMRWGSGVVGHRIGGGAWTSLSCTGIDPARSDTAMRIGTAFGAANFLHAKVMAVMSTNVALTDAQLDTVRTEALTLYGVSV